jgi:hypothetical protein
MKPDDSAHDSVPTDDATGLPGLRSWAAVYLAVLIVLAVLIGLLTALTRLYT